MKLLIHTLFASLFLTTFAAAESYDCKFKVRANDRKWIPTSLVIKVDQTGHVSILGNVVKSVDGYPLAGRTTKQTDARKTFVVETENDHIPTTASNRPIPANLRRVSYTISINQKDFSAFLRATTSRWLHDNSRRVAGTCKIR
ncbi:hypothetical protein [uncultured Aliiroseovarius sp.]|uniref:hypothetical protein n=1 Tax=uncultured Aliiroseovarius sp. TaxID=1658783 RepID=UPI00261A80B9|nr:hypothetical protein [uncultured Aliiroseovarius sp.]